RQLLVGGRGADDLRAVAPVQQPQGAQQLARAGTGDDAVGVDLLVRGERALQRVDLIVVRIAATVGNRAADGEPRRGRGSVGVLVPTQHDRLAARRRPLVGGAQRASGTCEQQGGGGNEVAAAQAHGAAPYVFPRAASRSCCVGTRTPTDPRPR